MARDATTWPPYHEERPWGSFTVLLGGTPDSSHTVKLITVKSGCRLSLQLHHHREEHWIITSGSGTVEIGDQTLSAKPGDIFRVPLETKHRVSAGPEGIVFNEYVDGPFNEEDIERFEDDFGRA